jgi:hypothetical protein
MHHNKIIFRLAGILAAGILAPEGNGQAFTFSTIAGGMGGTNNGANFAAQFSNPSGAAVDGTGNIYVADQLNNTIRKITPRGTNWFVSTVAGGAPGALDGTNSQAQFSGPTGIAVDSGTNLYIADQFNHAIRKITPQGTNWVVATIAGQAGIAGARDGTNTGAQFHNPTGIALDGAGNIYVADEFNNAIRRISPSGANWVVKTIAGGSFGSADGMGTNAQFFNPAGIAVDGGAKIFVADQFNNEIRLITPVGSNWLVTTIAGQLSAGTSNGLGTNAQFTSPVGLAIGPAGNLFVADQFTDAIRELSASGSNWLVSTIGGGNPGASDGVGTNAQFFLPYGVATDAYGDVYVADSGNNSIRLGLSSTAPPADGSLTVTLSPPGAVTAGAQWQLDGGAFQASGTTLAGLTPGMHTVAYRNIAGFTTPAWASITITAHQTSTLVGNYAGAIANAGSLQVQISPCAAISVGAEWQVDGGPYQTNGAIIAGLSVGAHSLSFSSAPGWFAPASGTINITNAQTTLAFGTYILQTGSLQVIINPRAVISSGAKWQLDGGEFQSPDTIITGVLPGSHTVAFNGVLGWNSPAPVNVAIGVNQTNSVTEAYLPTPPQLTKLTTGPGTVQFTLNGVSGCICIIQASSNLVNWTAISTNTIPPSGLVVISETPVAGQNRRFYRAVAVPIIYPQLTGPAISNGHMNFALNGSIGSIWIIQTSSNLVNWSAIWTNTIPAGGTATIMDPTPTNLIPRFYRAVMY